MKSRGRPQKNIDWPENSDFTTEDIILGSSCSLSSGLIHLKLKQALESGEIFLVGKTSKKAKGRPRKIYRKAK